MGVEEQRPRRIPTKNFDAPLTVGERIVRSVTAVRGGLVEPQRATVVTGNQINLFCGPCDFYQQDGTCRIELDSDAQQLRSVASGSCTFAKVDGKRGHMTKRGFISQIIQLNKIIPKRS